MPLFFFAFCMILAIFCFTVAAVDVKVPYVDLTKLGLALLALALLSRLGR